MGVTLGRTGARLSVAAAAMFINAPLHAQTLGQGDICDPATKLLDRERLALMALAKAGVSPYPLRWAQTHEPDPGDTRAATPAQQLLVGEGFCSLAPTAESGIPRCGKDDSEKLADALNTVEEVLGDAAHYTVPDDITNRAALFAVSSPPILCRAGTDGTFAATPTPIAPPFDPKSIPVRLRGSTDGLQFDRNRDSAFSGVEKAAVTFKSDRAAGKDSFKATIIAGVVVPVIDSVFEIVPYIGFQVDTSKKDGQPKDVTDDIIRAGTLFDFRTHEANVSHLFLLRPEFMSNRKEDSEVISATLVYQPIFNGALNDAINITTSGNQSLLSIIPRADVRVIAGDFTDPGIRSPADSQDFFRVGGQVGITLVSDIKWLPLELAVTETYLFAAGGSSEDLSYLKSALSVYFDEKKYFGVDLSYARGRRDDLSKREQAWSVGFGAKF